jgi:uncharacterized protein
MKSNLSRRKFIQNSSKAALALSTTGLITSCSFFDKKGEKYKIPHRKLGKTGLDVSILSFGAGTQFLQNNDGEWEKVLEEAVEGGINLFDTAPSYNASKFWQIGDGKSLDSSEERLGRILPAYREKILIATKLKTRNPDEAMEELEGSLKRMKTDYVDILMIHGISESDNIAEIENGIYKKMVRFKESGMVKYIGFTSMQHAQHAAAVLDNLDFDVTLITMNPTKYGDFADVVLPVARKKNSGILAMKVMRDIVGKEATPKELLEYAWTREGVATALIGYHGSQPLAENILLAREFGDTQFANTDREALEKRLASLAGPHALSWAQPGYRDGAAVVQGGTDFLV